MVDVNSALRQQLLNDYQHNFPLTPHPYAQLARDLGVDEATVLAELQTLRDTGTLSRIGAVLKPGRVGASTLAALAVPAAQLEAVAELVNSYAEVNHNYQREHRYNLWFVVTATDTTSRDAVLADIALRSRLEPLSLPLLADYHIDLGFALTPR